MKEKILPAVVIKEYTNAQITAIIRLLKQRGKTEDEVKSIISSPACKRLIEESNQQLAKFVIGV